jgi:hypothetical protein
MLCTVTIDLFKGLKKFVSIGNLVDYQYLREFEARFGKARKVVYSNGLMRNRFLQNPRKSASLSCPYNQGVSKRCRLS